MCSTVFEKVKKRLGPGIPSKQQLRMANGSVIPSEAHWEGYVNLGGIRVAITFEVFDSGGNWAFLFGKPSLEAFDAIHNYGNDSVTATGIGSSITVQNQVQYPHYALIAKVAGMNLALDVKQYKREWLTRKPDNGEATTKDITNVNVAKVMTSDKKRKHIPKSVKWARQQQWRKATVLAIIPKACFVGGQWQVKRRSRAETLNKSGPQASTEVSRQTEPLAPTAPVCIVMNDEPTQTYELGVEVTTEAVNAVVLVTKSTASGMDTLYTLDSKLQGF